MALTLRFVIFVKYYLLNKIELLCKPLKINLSFFLKSLYFSKSTRVVSKNVRSTFLNLITAIGIRNTFQKIRSFEKWVTHRERDNLM